MSAKERISYKNGIRSSDTLQTQTESQIAFRIEVINQKSILVNEIVKVSLPFATNCFCEARLPTFAIDRTADCNNSVIQMQPFKYTITVCKGFKSCVKPRFTARFCAVILIFVL